MRYVYMLEEDRIGLLLRNAEALAVVNTYDSVAGGGMVLPLIFFLPSCFP